MEIDAVRNGIAEGCRRIRYQKGHGFHSACKRGLRRCLHHGNSRLNAIRKLFPNLLQNPAGQRLAVGSADIVL